MIDVWGNILRRGKHKRKTLFRVSQILTSSPTPDHGPLGQNLWNVKQTLQGTHDSSMNAFWWVVAFCWDIPIWETNPKLWPRVPLMQLKYERTDENYIPHVSLHVIRKSVHIYAGSNCLYSIVHTVAIKSSKSVEATQYVYCPLKTA